MLPVYRGKFLDPEDVTQAFKTKCEDIIGEVRKSIANADKECPYDAEAHMNLALMRLREATEIVRKAADNYMNVSEEWKENIRKGGAS